MIEYTTEDIETMVAKDLEISRQLVDLLHQETPSIQQRDFASISQLLQKKAPLLDQLKQHAELRKRWLMSLYNVASEKNWGQLLASYNLSKAQQQWQEVNNNITECRKINEINGVMINRGSQTYAQLLQILRGDIGKTELYNAKGNKKTTSTYASVARA